MRRSLLVIAFLLAGCMSTGGSVCDTLYFGTNSKGVQLVSEEKWQAFVDDVISPRFPGFTQWSAIGDYERTREVSHVVQIIGGGAHEAKLREIMDEYNKRFDQESVLWVRTPARGILRTHAGTELPLR